MRTAYVVLAKNSEYNDETYFFEGGGTPSVVYLDKDSAVKACEALCHEKVDNVGGFDDFFEQYSYYSSDREGGGESLLIELSRVDKIESFFLLLQQLGGKVKDKHNFTFPRIENVSPTESCKLLELFDLLPYYIAEAPLG